MPYDITDARDDILLLDSKISAMLQALIEKGIIEKPKEVK